MRSFARQLHELLTRKGMSQSDLARAVFGTATDARGYTVARNRDRVSAYLNGRSYPEPANLTKIADALGVTPADLAPDMTAAAVDRENPEISMQMVTGQPNRVHLQVNKLVPLTIATQIITILTEYEQSTTPAFSG